MWRCSKDRGDKQGTTCTHLLPLHLPPNMSLHLPLVQLFENQIHVSIHNQVKQFQEN
jgi:hypothetical protein